MSNQSLLEQELDLWYYKSKQWNYKKDEDIDDVNYKETLKQIIMMVKNIKNT